MIAQRGNRRSRDHRDFRVGYPETIDNVPLSEARLTNDVRGEMDQYAIHCMSPNASGPTKMLRVVLFLQIVKCKCKGPIGCEQDTRIYGRDDMVDDAKTIFSAGSGCHKGDGVRQPYHRES